MVQVFRRRATDLAMTVGKEIKVHWKHGEKTTIKCRDLGVYASEFVETPVVYAQINERWAVAVADTPTDKYFHTSFVNGIWTSKGGTHVDYITHQVVSHIVDYLETKKKIKVKPGMVRDNLGVWVTSLIENPSFTSQTKETLTTKSSAFGSTCKLSDEFLKKVQSKLELVDSLIVAQKEKDDKENKKSDGKKQSKIYGIPKLDDAGWAGTAKSAQSVLILTEGDSAKAMALSGLTKSQREKFGVFPLRGKIMNVKDSSASKVELAKEIAELKKEVERLKRDLAEARDDEKYWQDNLVKAQDRSSAQEGAYLKVIQTLSGRN
jgi:DNA topoisomerase-2